MNNIILTIFLLVFALISIKNIRYGIYAIIFFMPLYLWRFSIGGIPTTALEIMIYILFLVWILNRIRKNLLYKNFYPALAEGFSDFNRLCKNNFILSIGIALLFLGLILSTVHSSDLRTSLGVCKGWFFDPFLFFIVFISVIKKDKQIILSLKSWIFSGVAVSLIGIFYLLNNELTFDGRLKAFFLSPNHLAMYLSPAFLIVLFFLLNKKVFSIQYFCPRRTSLGLAVFSIFLLIIFISLYFTCSYGAFLGVFIGTLYLFIKNKRLKIKNIYLLGFISFLLLGFIFVSSNKFNQITNSNNRSSFHSRLMIWNVAGEIIKDSPILGIGPGTFQETYLSYAERFDEPYLEWAVPQSHNIFLAFYLQTGLIGFVGFIIILIWFFSRRDTINRVSTTVKIYIINALMIYILIHGLVDTTYWKNDLSLIFWIVSALLLINSKNYDILSE
ncbi:MAG: O-antigen ligase family protein [Patescibacteria group bacterium]|nr:O-antigen ligase family protein [Patescibacteria group bacterium]